MKAQIKKNYDLVVYLLLALLAGHLTVKFGWWDRVEPASFYVSLVLIIRTMMQTKKAEKAYYKFDDNKDESFVVALEVGRPISEAAKVKFGHLDVLVRVSDIIGCNTLTSDEHYEKVARAVYSACAQAQTRQIELIVSGPTALCAIIGQMLGVVNFNVRVWQFYNGDYQSVPRPTRDWLEHRD